MKPANDLEARFFAATPRSLERFSAHADATPGGVAKGAYFYRPYPLTMERGDGAYLFDVDGNRYADFANHHTGQILGHNHPAVMAAVQAQLQRGVAVGAPMGHETEVCAELCSRVASLERARFTNSGTEASLHAVRLARAFTGRNLIAKFEGCYHGSHDAVEVSVAPPLEAAGPAERPLPYAQAIGMSAGAVADTMVLPLGDLEATDRLIGEHAAELACVLLDPKTGITTRHGVLMVFDEIVGFRLARGGAQEYYGITPDLTTFGKIVGGGFPVGAFGGRADIMDRYHPTAGPGVGQSGTFASHPVTMAAGLAMLRELTPAAFEHLASLGDRLTRGLRKALTACPPPRDYRSSLDADKRWVSPLFLALLDRGFFLGHTLGMCSISVPTTPQMIDELVEAVADALRDPAVKTAATDG
ncbi:Glutamate-1-semialdehyde 2,1-aminomutase [Geodia barretti]|uniref:Glutamate-1-semialdehyde 2,1-aminomutase n=1 Tax=Geodia barretti TaxID=519541 RepID=A0AA35W8K6_GEOBA|nr:Glutamate-1-semialdehyde 2,1-aminomutase [Geodia barretti]